MLRSIYIGIRVDRATSRLYAFDRANKSRSSLLLCTCKQRPLPRSAVERSRPPSDAPSSTIMRASMLRSCPRGPLLIKRASSARQHNNSEGAWRTLKSRSIRNGNCVPGAARFLRLVEHATENTRARRGKGHCLAKPCARAAQLSGAGALRNLSTQNERES